MSNIYVIGDLHGSPESVKDFVKRNHQLHQSLDNILICLGDFGGQYFLDERDDGFKKELSKLPLTYFVIRGNHEERPSFCKLKNPTKWHIESFFNNTVLVENDYPRIKYALDEPAIYTIEIKDKEYNAIVLPGAYSVDKYFRLEKGWHWFEKEQMTDIEKAKAESLLTMLDYKVDIVLSHTCPYSLRPVDLFIPSINQKVVDSSTEHFLEEIYQKLDYKLWLWGHYHKFRYYPTYVDKKAKRVMLYCDVVIKLEEFLTSDIFSLY